MDYISEKQIDQIASETCRALSGEPKQTVIIAEDGNAAYWEGGVNGHFFRIRRGVPVEVPKSLALLISQSADVLRQSERAVQAYRKSGGKRVL